MGSYVNSHIVLIGSADAIHNAMGDVIAAKAQFNNVTYSNNDTRIDLCVETISEAPELFVKKLKDDNKLDAAFVKAVDYDSYEIAYFKDVVIIVITDINKLTAVIRITRSVISNIVCIIIYVSR